MIEPLPEKIERALKQALAPGEQVLIKLHGAFKEALVCTSTRVIILKAGWMTGQLFGTDIFQCPYQNISGAQVKFDFLTGYFELSAGGMQNTAKSFWNTDRRVNAAKAPNCISISGAQRAARFREACSFIMQRVSAQASTGANQAGADLLVTLEKLSRLRDTGVISDSEFKSKKAEILSRV